ncbi:ARM repeat-containing protein, partial [Agrocybe pediades]
MDSFELQEEISALQDLATYEIPHELETEEAEYALEDAVEAVANSSSAIRDGEIFDVYRSLLKHSSDVSGRIMSKMLDSISSGLHAEMDATLRDIDGGDQPTYVAHRMPLEMYAFLLHWFVVASEKVKAPEEGEAPPAKGRKKTTKTTNKKAADTTWSWKDQAAPTLKLICTVLSKLPTQRIWTTNMERDVFIKALTKPAIHITELESWMKTQEIRIPVFKAICLSVKNHGQAPAIQDHLIFNLPYSDHLAEPAADLLTLLYSEYDFSQLGDELLRQIAGMSFGSQDAKGPRNFARFLIRYGESCPRLVLKQFSLLVSQLDSEAYPIRQAIVEIIGSLITELANGSEEGEAKQAQRDINNFFNLLLDRVLDISGYVRTRVLQVLAKLCDIEKFKFPKQRLAVTSAAIEALDDKIASVRKAAIALLTQLLLTHPYFRTHDGCLQRDLYAAEYKEVSEELGKIEDAVGNAVKRAEGENVDDEEEEEEGDDGGDADSSRRKKKKKKSKKSGDDDDEEGDDSIMDVDDDDEAGGDTEEDEGDEMSVDEEGTTPKKKKEKKPSKLERRKSQLNLEALNEEQAILAKYDEATITKMQLRKKYLSDALSFIDQIEGAMDTMCKLLGSTSKAEVLEVMDFFRMAHDLKFESANAGIKKMLHLIWTKDNSSTSEDGKELKGIRQRLLECYRGLYFEVLDDPTMTPKDQISRIAKNLIERTYDATLAELTSLEEMMRIMMDEQAIHKDIINKLWQVYSVEKQLPKPQRRGAIMILGMLALSDVGVIADKVDIMLKVGLGPLGKADPTLARYTCVALQRLNGSFKKVKGSLDDKTRRISMDSPIFKKLQTAILHPSRTKEWFGMAEQVINTVYALAEHPDVFCNEVIKKLTVRAFTAKQKAAAAEDKNVEKEKESTPATNEDNAGDATMDSADVTMQDATQATTQATQDDPDKEKDVGEAFEMSQLLFVVGHVAIKHVVFLELVEREWKRQKDEKQAAEKAASGNTRASKEGEELDQVAGNAED